MNKQRKYAGLILLSVLIASISGCNIFKRSLKVNLVLNNDYCLPFKKNLSDELSPSYSHPDSLFVIHTLLSPEFSEEEILIANCMGIIPQLSQLLKMKQDTSAINHTVNLLKLNDQVQRKILLVQDEIEGIADELDCEAQRTRRIYTFLDNLEKSRNNTLTAGSILFSAVTTIIPVLVKKQSVQNGILIGGGTISAIMGLGVLLPNKKKVEMTYSRNLLTEIWYGSARSDLYPPCIWSMLSQKEFNNSNPQISIQQNIKERWLKLEFNKKISKSQEELIFNRGGIYDEDNLLTREVLLNQLKASIRLLNLKVDIVSKAINRVLIKS